MIDGDWGCGKTYYLEHDFQSLVKEIDSFQKPEVQHKIGHFFDQKDDGAYLKYEPAIISLYGLSSAEDFYNRVFLGVNKWAKNKWWGVGGAIMSKVAGIIGVSAEKKDLSAFTLLDDHHVLVFDDLERICLDKITYKEVLGMINAYSEQDGRKVIIVCNENEVRENMNSDGTDSYNRYKEKTIRFTYKFLMDVNAVFDSLVEQTDNKDYKAYLTDNKDLILKLFELGGNKNLRTLKFIIEIFEKLYKLPTGVYKEKLEQNLLVSTMIYAMEYKQQVEVEELKALKEQFVLSLDSTAKWLSRHVHSAEQENQRPSLEELMTEKYGYYFTDTMHRIPEIVDYITTGCLDNNAIQKQLCTLAEDYKRAEGTPAVQVYRRLNSLISMDDAKVREDIDQMLGYVKDGQYTIYDLMHVYALLLKYNHWKIEGFELTQKIDDLFYAALQTMATTHVYNPAMMTSIPLWDDTNPRESAYLKYKKLHDLAMNINDRSQQNKIQDRVTDLVRAAEEGSILKLREFRNNEDVLGFAESMDWGKVCSIIESARNPVACELICCIEYILRHDYHANREDLSVLGTWVTDYLHREDSHIRKMYVTELAVELKNLRR